MANVVIVDDNKLLRTLLADIMRSHGHTVRVAEQGEEALALIQEASPDLVITDYYMPVMDGGELIRIIRSGAVGKPDLPVIALAGSLRAEQSTVEAGCSLYLPKPLREPVLMEAVNSLLAGKK